MVCKYVELVTVQDCAEWHCLQSYSPLYSPLYSTVDLQLVLTSPRRAMAEILTLLAGRWPVSSSELSSGQRKRRGLPCTSYHWAGAPRHRHHHHGWTYRIKAGPCKGQPVTCQAKPRLFILLDGEQNRRAFQHPATGDITWCCVPSATVPPCDPTHITRSGRWGRCDLSTTPITTNTTSGRSS